MAQKNLLSCILGIALLFGSVTEAAVPLEEQVDLLSRQEQIWKTYMHIDEAIAQDGHFAVTDLDNNGRLELLFTTTVGEQEFREFIENWGYEVNENEDGVSLLVFLNGPDATQILQPCVPMYFACQMGQYHYIFQNACWSPTEESGWKYGGALVGLYLEQGKVHQELLGSFSEFYKNKDLPPVERVYSDHNAKSISAETYRYLARERYDDCHPYEVTVGWRPVTELAKAMEEQKKVRKLFLDSWKAFRMKELHEPMHRWIVCQ